MPAGFSRDAKPSEGAAPPPPSRLEHLAPYAAQSGSPGPRAFAEAPASQRTAFQRDRDRLVHSIAFRRLASKTQVLLPDAAEQHRTRLTHTLEVAQIARSMARSLRLDEDLAEALALAHDFGHGPFGHTGEAAIDEVLRPWGGFDHNVQSLRIVVDIEQRYLDFDGLNLTWTTLEGLAKRKGPTATPSALLRDYETRFGLQLDLFPSAEAQVAAVADDIAYNAHDLEDGLRAGLLTLEESDTVPLVRELRQRIEARHARVDTDRLPFALARGLVDLFVTDAIAETRQRLAAAAPPDIDALRRLNHPVAGLSAAMVDAEDILKRFLFTRLYRHPRLSDVRARAHDLVARLTERLLATPERLPERWAARALAAESPTMLARIAADYVAGLTDRQAVDEHARLFDGPGDFI